MWIGVAAAWAIEPCDHGASCFALAQDAADPAEAQAYLEQGCVTGDRGLCVRAALGRVERGASVDDVLVSLDELCNGAVADGCEAAELLRRGAPPRSFAAQRAGTVLKADEVWDQCYWPRVLRGGDPWGDLRAVVQYGPDGAYEGAVTTGRYVDDALRSCVSEYAASVSPEPTARGVRIHYIWPFDYGARVSVNGTEFTGFPTHRLEACFEDVDVERVALVVRRSHAVALGATRWVSSSGSDAADDCVLALLTEHVGSLDVGKARIEIWPHQCVRPSPRPLPAPDDSRQLPPGTPLVMHLSPSSLPPPSGGSATCIADVTIEPDGYASRVEVRECPENLHDSVVAPLMSWQWAVASATVATLEFVFREEESRIMAGGRTLAYTRRGPPPTPSGSP